MSLVPTGDQGSPIADDADSSEDPQGQEAGAPDQEPVDGGAASIPREQATLLWLEWTFEAQLEKLTSDGIPYRRALIESSLSGMSYTYYDLQIPLDGIISMYEATGRDDLLELALELCENMVASAWDRDGDGHPEWDGSFHGVPPSDGHPDMLLPDLQGAVALARLARLIVSDAALDERFGVRGRALARFVSHDIVDKWLETRGRLNWFFNLPHWSDKASMLTRILADLFVCTGRPDRRALAETLARQFIETTLVYDEVLNAYTWPEIPASDTAHTNREAFMFEVLARTQIVFDDEDVQRVANTFVFHIWDGSYQNPHCVNFHTGLNDEYRERGPWVWGRVYNGWILTGRVDPIVQRVGRALVGLTQTDPTINPSVLNSSAPGKVMAFCGHLARNLEAGPAELPPPPEPPGPTPDPGIN